MQLIELFPAERIFLNLVVSNRKELLAALSERAAALGLVEKHLCGDALKSREELGSTGLGNGIALPHARVEGLPASVGILATLAKPIDFEAVDQEPVDVVMMVLMPVQSGAEQMKVLSRVARLARREDAVNALRRAGSVDEALAVIAEAEAEA